MDASAAVLVGLVARPIAFVPATAHAKGGVNSLCVAGVAAEPPSVV